MVEMKIKQVFAKNICKYAIYILIVDYILVINIKLKLFYTTIQ